MMKEAILLIINLFLSVIEGITGITMLVSSYALRVWRNNALRNFVLNIIRYTDYFFSRLKNYLEEIGLVLRYRMQYEGVARELKLQYREIKKIR